MYHRRIVFLFEINLSLNIVRRGATDVAFYEQEYSRGDNPSQILPYYLPIAGEGRIIRFLRFPWV